MTLFKLYVLENIQLYNRKRLEKLNTVEKKNLLVYTSFLKQTIGFDTVNSSEYSLQ